MKRVRLSSLLLIISNSTGGVVHLSSTPHLTSSFVQTSLAESKKKCVANLNSVFER